MRDTVCGIMYVLLGRACAGATGSAEPKHTHACAYEVRRCGRAIARCGDGAAEKLGAASVCCSCARHSIH